MNWKVLAWVFIAIVIIENILLIWVINIGLDSLNQEDECSYNVCADYPTYFYDEYDEICYCYNSEGEVMEYLFLGG